IDERAEDIAELTALGSDDFAGWRVQCGRWGTPVENRVEDGPHNPSLVKSFCFFVPRVKAGYCRPGIVETLPPRSEIGADRLVIDESRFPDGLLVDNCSRH